MRNLLLWIGALVVGAVLGLLGVEWLNGLMDFVATVYTRLFQLLAVPPIALAVITTLDTCDSQYGFQYHGYDMRRRQSWLYVEGRCSCRCCVPSCRYGLIWHSHIVQTWHKW